MPKTLNTATGDTCGGDQKKDAKEPEDEDDIPEVSADWDLTEAEGEGEVVTEEHRLLAKLVERQVKRYMAQQICWYCSINKVGRFGKVSCFFLLLFL